MSRKHFKRARKTEDSAPVMLSREAIEHAGFVVGVNMHAAVTAMTRAELEKYERGLQIAREYDKTAQTVQCKHCLAVQHVRGDAPWACGACLWILNS